MISTIHKLKLPYLLISILIMGGFLRFYNLNWGAPFYFHPDERNIAGLISSFPISGANYFLKGTFSYGTFVSNIVLFIKMLSTSVLTAAGLSDPFSQSMILLRFVSAISSLFTILVVFYIGYRFKNLWTGIVSATLTTFSTGLIQAAHFAVYESFLTLMSVVLFLACMLYVKSSRFFYIFISIIIVSVSTASKINSVILLLVPLVPFLYISIKQNVVLYEILFQLILLLLFFMTLTILLSPYYATEEFRNLLVYEKTLLTGVLPVFYTGEFFNTTPILFQFRHIYPFLINPLLTLLFVPSFFYVFYKGLKKKDIYYILLSVFFVILFLPGALLFTKWTRYMVPSIPFILLIISSAGFDFIQIIHKITPKKNALAISYFLVISVITISIVFSVSYFITTFIKEDTRISASLWAKEHLPRNTKIISEVYDLGITPFNGYFSNIFLYNFYDLDTFSLSTIPKDQFASLSRYEYIILPSQRIAKTRLLSMNKFPNGHIFYSELFSGNLGYTKIYETPCDIFCKIIYLNNTVFSFEETASVFDRPTVFIFKKNEI